MIKYFLGNEKMELNVIKYENELIIFNNSILKMIRKINIIKFLNYNQ